MLSDKLGSERKDSVNVGDKKKYGFIQGHSHGYVPTEPTSPEPVSQTKDLGDLHRSPSSLTSSLLETG